MSKLFFSKGDYICTEDGEHKFRLLEAAEFNEKLYLVRAKDIEQGRDCLLKFVVDGDETFKSNNLLREGGFQFHYPYIEHVYGNFHGVDPNGDKIFGVAVEFIKGQDLKSYRMELQDRIRRGEIILQEAEKIIFRQMLQFLYGMNYYSQFSGKGFLHRDIKPENIMITEDGDVKIVDFDYAHIAGSKKTLNATGWDFAYSKGYTSPQINQLRKGKDYGSIKMDIYSAGRVFFYWLNAVNYYTKEDSTPVDDDISSTPYLLREDLGYGIEANAHRFDARFYRPKYKKMMRILAKMCANPKDGDCYENVREVLRDMKDFLLEYCGNSPRRFEEYVDFKSFPILEERMNQNDRKSVMVAHKVYGYPKVGKPLYEYTMRDIIVDGQLMVTIYNMDNEIYYIPALGVDIQSERGNRDYKLRDKDVLIYGDVEITFTISKGRD